MHKRYLITSVGLLAIINIPYLIALAFTDPDVIFGGFLLNPVDGYSYLAKMVQGFQGGWLFTLPFSAEPNQGAPLFWFYLFLGHCARLLGLSPVLMFHLARILSSVALLIAIKGFFERIFTDRPRTAYWAFVLANVGSGCGWIASFMGGFTSDFWVAEAYPFLAMYSSPHFSLGLALLVWFATQFVIEERASRIPILVGAGLLLGSVLPFGIVVAALVAVGDLICSLVSREKIRWPTIFAFLLPGGLFILYQFYIIRTDPVLAQWDSQNLTASPPVWDILISFFPLAAFAAYGVFKAVRLRRRQLVILGVWLVIGLFLIYVPFNLQRRFMLGYMIPVAGLAAFGLSEIKSRSKNLLKVISVGMAMPTLLIVITGGIMAVRNSNPNLVMARAEVATLAFLAESSGLDDLVLASPETGLLIPAYTGRRVIYGHPFETVNASMEKNAVEDFYRESMNASSLDWARERKVRWILWGPREQAYGSVPVILPDGVFLVYQNQDVQLFSLQDSK